MATGSSAPSSPDLVGRVLGGRYRLTVALGGGASAAVFAAEDVVLRRAVAVKVLHPALAADEGFLRRFQAEARIAAALRHPNVLAVHDWGDDGGAPFLVTELLEGGSLKGLLDSGFRASPAQALQLGLEACRGLDHAHRRGLVHRDVKPANLLFDDEAHLRVADFGLARAIAEAAATEPLGTVLGTARYTSPEQVEGRPLDGRSDVYSLALVLIEAVTGEVPFAAETSAATLLARLERPLEPPPAMGPLAEALAAAGRTDPEQRSDAATFGRMLKAAATRLDRPAPLPLVGLEPLAASPTELADHLGPGDTVLPGSGPSRPYDDEVDGTDGTAPAGAEGHDPSTAVTGSFTFVRPEAQPQAAGPPAAAPPDVEPSAPPARRARRGRKGRRQPAGVPAAPPIDLEPRPPAPRPRRRGRMVLLLLLVLVVAGAAAAAAVVQPWRPTVDVPDLTTLSREEAAVRLRPEDLELKVDRRIPSEVVPAGVVLDYRPARQRQGKEVTVTLSSGPEERTLPAVAGRPAIEVEGALRSLRLTVVTKPIDSETVPIGTTLAIEPPPGTRVPRDATVTISVSAGPPERPVPDVAGKSADEAIAALQVVGLKGTVVEVFDEKVAAGRVVRTNPVSGVGVRPGLAVAVNVSKGPDLVTVPNVSGRTPSDAQAAMGAAGVVVSTTYGPPSGQVFSSQPAAGAKVRRGSQVALYTR